MKGYVINLDSRPDRLELFKENKFPFEVERVPGVVASCGQDGCTEAHLSVLRKKHEFPFIVFEDDCKMIEPWETVELALSQLPQAWDGLWLGASISKWLKRYSDNLYRLNRGYTLHAVIYNSQKMIDYILENHNTPSGTHLDVFYRYHIFEQYACFITFPMCATQRAGVNNITGEYVDYEEYMLRLFKKYTKKYKK